MARPGQLTRGKANRLVKTPGGKSVVHRQKFYKAGGVCHLTGSQLQLPKASLYGLSRRSSRSSKRPNRPYGGVLSSAATRREIITKARE
ncbi:MAG: 50S ribosomal protein L34e [Candidatus Thorarchaeota archaeon]|nr:MAG: 50S ribosomal protein L34e [Candidatus Thorarchaeota archaeon]